MSTERGIAIVGMACRFPGANTPREFWDNLRHGVESITVFSDAELLAAGVPPESLRDPTYIKASPVLSDIDKFDAAFFGYSPKEAAILDPQHRLFLETCWEAFEDAGYNPEGNASIVGVFAAAGSALTSYLFAHAAHPDMWGQTASVQHIDNDKDFLSTRVSFKLNLTGPSLTVQTACSSSLVAVHLACQSLESGECDMAIAGAATIRVPHVVGYFADRGSVHSRDGHCRAFDAEGTGTIFGSGVAAIVLKPLAAALDEGDHIYAVVKGTAVNNDGSSKISYTAASTTGQARAIVEALEASQIEADSIDYVECHATGTVEGDPVEIHALRRAFALHRRTRPCIIGSVKTNIGHPEQAAGLAGLIKTALSLKHRAIPPSLHYSKPNPRIPLSDGLFKVQAAVAEWPRGDTPRRAGVNSLGIGGTNAFVVVEEAPERRSRETAERLVPSIFSTSAKTSSALAGQVGQLVKYLDCNPEATLEEICYTANVSRSQYQHRFAAVCSTKQELRTALTAFRARLDEGRSTGVRTTPSAPRRIAFLFSGQGTPYAGMATPLYRAFSPFREALDECDALLQPHLNTSLAKILVGEGKHIQPGDTATAQPAIFAIEYATAQLWKAWGITPTAVMGHSVGEIAAACVAGILSLSDAIEFVAERGALMQGLPPGVMEAFFADEACIRTAIQDLGTSIDIAAINGPHNTVVSGEIDAVEELRNRLHAAGISSKRLTVSRAFHSALVEPILGRLEEAAARMACKSTAIPCISNVTGKSMDGALPSSYWRDHARRPVRFFDGMQALDQLECEIFVEVGPGSTLLAMGRECLPQRDHIWLPSINPHKLQAQALESLAAMYSQRHDVAWTRLWQDFGPPDRVPLPTYPFERRRFWLDEQRVHERVVPRVSHLDSHGVISADSTGRASRARHDDLAQSVYGISWMRCPEPKSLAQAAGAWLIFADSGGLGVEIAAAQRRKGHASHLVFAGDRFASIGPGHWTIDPSDRSHVAQLVEQIQHLEPEGTRVVLFLWSLDTIPMHASTFDSVDRAVTCAPRSLLHVVQELGESPSARGSRLWIVTRGAQGVVPGETAEPAQALLWGFARTIALELPTAWGGTIDLPHTSRAVGVEAEEVVRAVTESDHEQELALRNDDTYVPRLERLRVDQVDCRPIPVRSDGTYLITGGLGMLGLQTAKWLVEQKGARVLVLASRNATSAAARPELAHLEALGAHVRLIAADVADERDVCRMLEGIRRDLPPLKGIIHSAGVLADAILSRMKWATFESALAPKVRGMWLLHEHTRDAALDFFAVHSSLLSLTGSVGQANYTAANAFLDAFVQYRRASGLPGMAINWGPWAGAGMAIGASGRSEELWRARGITLIGPSLGRDALGYMFDNAIGSAAFTLCNWDQYVTQLPRPSTVYGRLLSPAPRAADGDGLSVPDLPMRLAQATLPGRRGVLLEALRSEVTRELGLDDDIDTREPLQQLGVDSLMSVNLANRLEARLGVRVPVATIVRGPSLEGLTDELLDGFGPPDSRPEAPTQATQQPPQERQRDSQPREGGWLVFPKPNPAARVRLFCFNFAGGGAASFRSWAPLLADWIELVAIEPPGRGGRIDEPAFTRLDAMLERLMPAMAPYLDKPAAFFGHCLGALTLFESTRHLVRTGFPDLVHVFVSGARPPHRIDDSGRFEEDLLAMLLKDHRFDPLRPFHEQPDDTFATLLRQFNIWATADFLAHAELRALLLPAIRADFKAAASYRYVAEAPWETPITCFNGLDDPYVTRGDAVEWNRYTKSAFTMHLRNGNHFLVVEDRDFIVSTINSALRAAA